MVPKRRPEVRTRRRRWALEYAVFYSLVIFCNCVHRARGCSDRFPELSAHGSRMGGIAASSSLCCGDSHCWQWKTQSHGHWIRLAVSPLFCRHVFSSRPSSSNATISHSRVLRGKLWRNHGASARRLRPLRPTSNAIFKDNDHCNTHSQCHWLFSFWIDWLSNRGNGLPEQ